MKFLLAQFLAYALAAFAIGVAVGFLWQRRPVAVANDRVRRLERSKLTVETQLADAERALAAAEQSQGLVRDRGNELAQLRAGVVELRAERHAAVAAKDAAESQVVQLRSDLDRRILPSFSSVSPSDQQRQHSADIADLRAEHQQELDRRSAERTELLHAHAVATAALEERLAAVERERQAAWVRHNQFVHASQTAITGALVRAEQAEAAVSVARSAVARSDQQPQAPVIDLRSTEPANQSSGESR